MRKTNPHFQPVKYFMSHTSGGYDVEHFPGARLAVMYYRAGTLMEAIGPQDTTLHVMVDAEHSLLKVSTAEGNYSTSATYVIFILVGSELMKVTKVSTPSMIDQVFSSLSFNPKMRYVIQTLTVVRGFDDTVAVEHAKNANVLAPAYNQWPGQQVAEDQRMMSSDSDDESPTDRIWDNIYTYYQRSDNQHVGITYEVDPAASYAWEILANSTIEAVGEGYSGSWYDCFSDGELRPVDLGGKPLEKFPFWNPRLDAPYTKEEFDTKQRMRLTHTWEIVNNSLHYYPTILANNVVTFYFIGGRWDHRIVLNILHIHSDPFVSKL